MKSYRLFQPTRRTRGRVSLVETLERRDLLAVVSLVASRDNSLFQDAQGTKSNGSGDFLFAGRTHQPDGLSLRRALMAFDLTGQIPDSANVLSVSLSLRVSKSISDDVPIGAHRLLNDWGEAASNAAGDEGKGGTAAPEDVTWLHRSFPDIDWTVEGGEFVREASATAAVAGAGETYTWSSDQMIADVNAWLENPQQNFGWILVGGEDTNGTAKRFNSRENSDASTRPTLIIEFEEVADLPTVSVADTAILESDIGTSMPFTISLSTATAVDVTVDYATVSATAAPNTDFAEATGTVTFTANGPLTQMVAIPVVGDNVHEADETFLLRLSNPTNAAILDGESEATILNDDPIPAISISDLSIGEGDEGNQLMQVPVELSNPSAFEVRVDYQTQPSSAEATDFVESSATLVFAAGETSKTVNIQIVGDTFVEADEVFSVLLSSPTNAVIADNEATLTIENDDTLEFPWQNPELALDVTGDGAIVPRDVLLIINYINSQGSGPLPVPSPESPPPFYDTTGDGQITPRDALVIINFINSRNEAEPEPSAVDAVLALNLAEHDDLKEQNVGR